MKIVFECLGFATNPCFIDRGDERPLPYGTIVTNLLEKKLDFWPENYDPNYVSESAVIAEYEKQYAERGVCINDVSKDAWLNDTFGEVKETP
jgi:hypothetical protein